MTTGACTAVVARRAATKHSSRRLQRQRGDRGESVREIDRFFGSAANRTTVRTEIVAGATTYLTMAYIVFVNPVILGEAGMDRGAVFVATCLAAALRDLADGALRQLPAGAGAGHGDQRLFHLRRRQGAALQLAGGARRGVPVRRAVPDPQPDPRARRGWSTQSRCRRRWRSPPASGCFSASSR